MIFRVEKITATEVLVVQNMTIMFLVSKKIAMMVVVVNKIAIMFLVVNSMAIYGFPGGDYVANTFTYFALILSAPFIDN